MSAFGLGHSSGSAVQIGELKAKLAGTQTALEQTQAELGFTRREIERHRTRDLLVGVRLQEYGPMFIKMFDEGRDYKIKFFLDKHESVTSTSGYDIIVHNDVDAPVVIFRVTVDEPGLSFPMTTTIYLHYINGKDIHEDDFEEIEDWFVHALSGVPVDRDRHKRRCEEASALLPYDPRTVAASND